MKNILYFLIIIALSAGLAFYTLNFSITGPEVISFKEIAEKTLEQKRKKKGERLFEEDKKKALEQHERWLQLKEDYKVLGSIDSVRPSKVKESMDEDLLEKIVEGSQQYLDEYLSETCGVPTLKDLDAYYYWADLNNDGLEDVIVRYESLCDGTHLGGTGGNPWQMFISENGGWREVGGGFGSLVLVGKNEENYRDLGFYQHLSASSGTMKFYSYDSAIQAYQEVLGTERVSPRIPPAFQDDE